MTLTAILWTLTTIGLAALTATETPKDDTGKVLTFVGSACLLWTAGVLCWLIVGRVMEVVG